MTEHSLYNIENGVIRKSEEVINDERLKNSPLFDEFVSLSESYKKLFKHFSRIVKINDMQQDQLRKSQEEILKYNEDLKQTNATKDKFFSIISHDLKSPINSFLNMTTILVDHIDMFSKEEVQEMAIDVKNSGDNLMKLMENLLNWARLQMDRIEFQPEICFLNTVVEDNMTLLSNRIDEKGIRATNRVSEDAAVLADPNMLRSILHNLISNAVKFTGQDGEISVSSININGFIETTVSDTGIGISDEDLDKLFRLDVIYTNVGTANEKGTGLGLILCKEMIEKHDGKIRVESKEGQGTSFSFTCPATETDL
ncbi:MAG: HAMP domain-containing histidine kinase [Proteobacteria bacterium]|nr:HAMP domain-containing histidine kinase [Pseudomonadota bacterium]